MKTAVSIPDDLFEAAEKLAERLSVSRSALYAKALAAYVESLGGRDVTARLDEVYQDEESSVDPALAKLQNLSLPREDW